MPALHRPGGAQEGQYTALLQGRWEPEVEEVLMGLQAGSLELFRGSEVEMLAVHDGFQGWEAPTCNSTPGLLWFSESCTTV